MNDPYRVLPHRDVKVIHATIFGTDTRYEHKPCGMDLTEADVKDANWCPHCPGTINKAAQRRGQAEWK